MLFFIVKFMFLFLLLNGCVKNNDDSSTSGSSNTHKSSGNPPPGGNKNTNSGDTTEEVKPDTGENSNIPNNTEEIKPNTGDSAKEAKEESAKLTESFKKFDEFLEKNKQKLPESSKKNKETSKFKDDYTKTKITLDFKKLTAEAKAAKLAEKKAKEEAAKLAQEEAEKKAQEEEAKSKDGIIKQIQDNADKNTLVANINNFLTNNSNSDDIKAVLDVLATKEDNYIKDVNAKLTAEHKLKIRPHLKDALTKTKSEFKADVILGLGTLNFTNSERDSLKNNTSYVASVDYTKTTFGDMLINKKIKDKLDDFNTNLKSKYDDFKKTCNIEDKSEDYNKERFYHLLRSEKIGDNYFINRLVYLPASGTSYTMLKDLLDNTENPKEFLSSTQSLLLHLTKTREFTPFKDQTNYLAENENEKIKMIGLLLDKGRLSLIKEEDFKNLLPIIKDNKLNIDDLITNSTEKELENFATIFAKANYSDESNAIAANNLLNKILENKNITTQIKKDILVNLLSNNNKKFIDAMPTNLINNNALIDGVSNNENIALLSNYIVAKNDLINLIKDDKNKKTQVELLNYLSANDANNNLDLFEKLLENTNFTADELKNSLSNFCNEKWHRKINYNTEYAYNNQKRIELMKNLILSNAEIPKNIADEDVKNILESSKENKQILEILFKNDKFLDTFLSYTTDTLKTEASYEALKSNINASTSKFLNKALNSNSIPDDKKNELFSLLLENGANLNDISSNTVFENKLKLVPDDKMSGVLSSLTHNDKINIAVKYAVENLKADFTPSLLELTNRSNIARNAVIETALNRNINELVDLINNPENYGLAKEQITKNDYALSNIKFDGYSEAYKLVNNNGNLLMHLFPKIIKDKENIKNIVLALKNYFNKEEWLKYLLETDYESNIHENEKYNFIRFMRNNIFSADVNKYYEFINDIGVSNEDFTQQDKYKLYKLLSEFDKKNTIKSMNLFYDFYFNTFLFLNEKGIKNMKKYIKANIPSDSDNKLNNALKKFDEAYFKMFNWK